MHAPNAGGGPLSRRIHSACQGNRNARLVYLNSLNGYLPAIGEEWLLNLQLHELLTFPNQQGGLQPTRMPLRGAWEMRITERFKVERKR
jgi:hypothetical protein